MNSRWGGAVKTATRFAEISLTPVSVIRKTGRSLFIRLGNAVQRQGMGLSKSSLRMIAKEENELKIEQETSGHGRRIEG